MYLCLTTCYKFKGCSKKISLCFIDLFLWLKYFIDELVNGSFVLAKPFPYITEIFYISPCIIFLIANSRPNINPRTAISSTVMQKPMNARIAPESWNMQWRVSSAVSFRNIRTFTQSSDTWAIRFANTSTQPAGALPVGRMPSANKPKTPNGLCLHKAYVFCKYIPTAFSRNTRSAGVTAFN